MTTRCAFLLCTGLLATFFASGQNNDDCANAIFIPQVENFCSPVWAGDNTQATASSVPVPVCFAAANHDVWFYFTAVAANLTIIVRGNTADTPGGTLQAPAVALYAGPCSQLLELACQTSPIFNNIVELSTGGLTPGETYYFRVDGVLPGTFQYCLRNYFFGGTLSGDCPTALRVCDKMSFNVAAVAGPGIDPTEMDDTPCALFESNSTWYVFTAAANGSLEFTLTPNNASDDLDFVVYRLPHGPGNCADKVVLRCMAAGEFSSSSPCMGPTGLSDTATDISAPPGCASLLEDNFLAALNMTAGTTYALVVNDYTSSGNGYQLDWGGDGPFSGPEVGFISDQPDSACLGEAVLFTDTSRFDGGSISDWRWNFGLGAQPDTSDLQAPPAIRYTSPGQKIITLTIKTSTGCAVTTTRTFVVDTCCALTAAVELSLECAATCPQANIIATNGWGALTYAWSSGQTDTLATTLRPGDYVVTVSDAIGCTDTVNFKIPEPLFFIPNAFTPNGDGINDLFFPGGSGFEVLDLEVYSRWGQKVWSGSSGGWDGKLEGVNLPSDIYVYRGKVRFKGLVEERKGEVLLLR